MPYSNAPPRADISNTSTRRGDLGSPLTAPCSLEGGISIPPVPSSTADSGIVAPEIYLSNPHKGWPELRCDLLRPCCISGIIVPVVDRDALDNERPLPWPAVHWEEDLAMCCPTVPAGR